MMVLIQESVITGEENPSRKHVKFNITKAYKERKTVYYIAVENKCNLRPRLKLRTSRSIRNADNIQGFSSLL